jgi:hypothetical protein
MLSKEAGVVSPRSKELVMYGPEKSLKLWQQNDWQPRRGRRTQ